MRTKHWRQVAECIDAAFSHYEKRLRDIRAEAMDVFYREINRRGLSEHVTTKPTFPPPTTVAPHGRGKTTRTAP